MADHPDKGGDESRFHELTQAIAVLEDPAKRGAYDEELRQARERAELVEGGPAGGPKDSKGIARVKTAPTPGSVRSRKRECTSHGQYTAFGKATTVLKAITDDTSQEKVSEALFQRYSQLPR